MEWCRKCGEIAPAAPLWLDWLANISIGHFKQVLSQLFNKRDTLNHHTVWHVNRPFIALPALAWVFFICSCCHLIHALLHDESVWNKSIKQLNKSCTGFFMPLWTTYVNVMTAQKDDGFRPFLTSNWFATNSEICTSTKSRFRFENHFSYKMRTFFVPLKKKVGTFSLCFILFVYRNCVWKWFLQKFRSKKNIFLIFSFHCNLTFWHILPHSFHGIYPNLKQPPHCQLCFIRNSLCRLWIVLINFSIFENCLYYSI